MLISKTVCQAGSLAYIVPIGLQLTLHYDIRGNLTNVYQGFGKQNMVDADFMQHLVRYSLIPNSIKLIGGSTDIWGVFCSDNVNHKHGTLPNCMYDDIKADIIDNPKKYTFYAGGLMTGAEHVAEATSMYTWMTMCKFNVLPLWTIPDDVNDEKLAIYLKSITSPIKYPLVAGFIFYESLKNLTYHSVDLKTATVDKVKKYTDSNGYINYDVTYDNVKITMPYSSAVKFNIHKGSQIVVDRLNVIWCDTQSSKSTNRLGKRVACEYCGKLIDVPESGLTCCSDTFCTSFLYPRIERLCVKLGIKLLPQSQIKKYIKSDNIQILSDVLNLPEYADANIELPLWEILNAVIPGEVGLTSEWLIKFCNKCNNQYETIRYYFNGPIRITTELDMEVPIRFARWLDLPQNINVIDAVVKSPIIHIKSVGKITGFDAPQLLLHKTLLITGTFKSGSTADMITLLQCYGANVVTEFDEFIDYVIIGDIKDNVNGTAVIGARSLNIPIVDEHVFFSHYGIDKDIENNLV